MISFFALERASKHGAKRSFKLRRRDVGAEKLALFSTFAAGSLRVRVPASDDGPETVLESREDIACHEWREDVEYEVFVPVVDVDGDVWTDVGPIGADRLRVSVQGRDVLVLRTREGVFALDAVCYHFGGPLEGGDIEDLGAGAPHACVIVCPWHKYRIDVRTGEGLYAGVDGDLVSKGPKQRVHFVREEDGRVFVRLNVDAERLESDHYAFMGLGQQHEEKV